MSCGVGHRHSKDPELLWLWYRPAATALTRLLSWELPYAICHGYSPKKTEKKKEKEITYCFSILCVGKLGTAGASGAFIYVFGFKCRPDQSYLVQDGLIHLFGTWLGLLAKVSLIPPMGHLQRFTSYVSREKQMKTTRYKDSLPGFGTKKKKKKKEYKERLIQNPGAIKEEINKINYRK